jgi:uncharacterized protein (TIGR03437 family)
MKARWIWPALALFAATLGWAANSVITHQTDPPLTSTATTVELSISQQTAPDDPPQIRTAAAIIEFNSATQTEAIRNASLTARGYVIADDQSSAEIIFAPLPVTLERAEPFLALSAAWRAQSADDAKLTLSVRASVDGNVWGDWQRSSLDGDPRAHSGLFFLPQETRFIQCRIEMERDPRGNSPTISEIRFRFISPGATPHWMNERMLSQPLFEGSVASGRQGLAGAGGNFPKPSIVSRIAWGCPDGDKPHRGQPAYTTVTHLIVHHTATGNAAADWPAALRSIWNFHVFTNGWSDIGYNYLIDPNGLIYEGRAGGDNVLGSHFSCANSGTMGTAMLGNFTSVMPAEKSLASLKYLLAWKSDQRAIDPLGIGFHGSTQLNLQNISGHRDANGSTAPSACPGTECPGNSFYPLLPALRNDIKGFTDPADDFSLSTQAASISLQTGSAGAIIINSATVKGASQTLRLELSGLAAGVTATINPPVITSGDSASLTLSVGANAVGGIYPLAITASGTTIRAQQLSLSVTGAIATVSAADYRGDKIARDAIVAAFGAGLATATQSATATPLPTTLTGVTIRVRDSGGIERLAPLFFVSPRQINYQIPPDAATGSATVTVINGNTVVANGAMQITDVAPSLFSASSDGSGVAAALALRVKSDNSQSYEAVAQYDDSQRKFIALPIDLSDGQVYLILFGTGLRYRSSQEAVKVKIGGVEVPVFYAGEQGAFAGLDQINALLPTNLSGRGEVDVEVTVDGQSANTVRLSLK